MNLSQLLLILRARRKIIVLTLLVTVVTATVVSLALPKSYKATTTLVLNYKGVDPVTGVALPAQLLPGYMSTQVDIINSKNVALKVVNELKLADIEAVKEEFIKDTKGEGNIRDWLATALLKKLDAVPSRESSVLDVSFTGNNPGFAAAVANAFAHAYQQTTVQLTMEPLRRASTYFNDQVKVLRDNLERAQNKLSAYQQEHGIVSVDNRLDVETARLNDLSTQLVVVQGQLMDASSRGKAATGNGAAESPDVMANPLVQNLKSSLAQAEAKFSELSQRLDQNHPQYQGAKAEVEKLRAELQQHVRETSAGVMRNANILQRREAELRTAVQAQKDKVLELNQARDQLSVLTRDLESAQRAYDTAMQRYNQTSIEGQSNQTDVAILNEAIPPLKPSSPKILFNVLVSVFLGTFLGVVFSVLAEYLDRRLRAADDFVEALNAPVLATIDWAVPANPAASRNPWRRLLPRAAITTP